MCGSCAGVSAASSTLILSSATCTGRTVLHCVYSGSLHEKPATGSARERLFHSWHKSAVFASGSESSGNAVDSRTMKDNKFSFVHEQSVGTAPVSTCFRLRRFEPRLLPERSCHQRLTLKCCGTLCRAPALWRTRASRTVRGFHLFLSLEHKT